MEAVWRLHYISETGNSITLPLLFPLCPAFLMIYLTPTFPDFYILECSHLLNMYTCKSQMHPKSWDSTDLLTLLTCFGYCLHSPEPQVIQTLLFPSAPQPKWLSIIKGPISSSQVTSFTSVPSCLTALLLLRPLLPLT